MLELRGRVHLIERMSQEKPEVISCEKGGDFLRVRFHRLMIEEYAQF